MASALSLSTSFVTGRKLPVGSPSPSPLCSVGFRHSQQPRVSAVCAAAGTVERTSSGIASKASLYEVLGVRMGASCHEVKAAYKRLARISHPDVAGKSNGSSAADEFMRIHAAYATLTDPEKRADYDRKLFRQQRPTADSAFSMSTASSPRFTGYGRRSWETDQCW